MHRLMSSSVAVGFALDVIVSTGSAYQCPSTPCPQSCGGLTCAAVCEVSCLDQLCSALTCMASGGLCSQIVVPAGATIDVCASIGIFGADYDGLHLTIDGTVRYVGEANISGQSIFNLTNVSNIMIDGSGLMTSIHPSPTFSATAIRLNNCQNITVSGLRFTNLNDMVKAEAVPSNGVTLTNLTGGTAGAGNGLASYGIVLDAHNVAIDGCQVFGAGLHGILLSGTNLAINNSSAADVGGSGLWLLDGNNASVDGFQTNSSVRLGPNPVCRDSGPDTGQRLTCVTVRDVQCDLWFQVELGVIGCYLENVTYGTAGAVGRPTTGTTVPRPINRIHWTNLSGPSNVILFDSACIGDDVSSCVGDTNQDNQVDVNDLLAVINAWGECMQDPWQDDPLGGTCSALPPCATPITTCPADLAPLACGNSTIDVEDLLIVIQGWGSDCNTADVG